MTSVIPATSATSLCVLFSPCIRALTYNAAAAIPVGPRPEPAGRLQVPACGTKGQEGGQNPVFALLARAPGELPGELR